VPRVDPRASGVIRQGSEDGVNERKSSVYDNRVFRAPRILTRKLGDDIVDPSGRGKAHGENRAIDGCAYARLTPRILEHALEHADFFGVLTVDYDYRRSTHLRRSDGSIESVELTPLNVLDTHEVILDRVGEPIENLYLVGTCLESGLCRVHDCERYVASGANLVIARRYCGEMEREQITMLVHTIYPIEEDRLYDFDGSTQSLADLLREVTLPPETPTATSGCGADVFD
jgi:hypothetical protein